MFSSEMEKAHYARIKFTVDLSNDLIKGLWDIGESKTYKAGTILAQPGQIVYHGYFIHKGAVCQYYEDPQGKKNVDTFIFGPKFLAPSLKSFFNRTPSKEYFIASTDIDVQEVETGKLFKFTEAHPETYKFLLNCAAINFREREIRQLNFKLNKARELYEILRAENPEVVDRIPLAQVASFLNIQPGSLSRIRKSMK